MADGFEMISDLSSLDKNLKSLDDRLKQLSETSELSAKRINKALSQAFIGTEGSSKIDALSGQMETLMRRMKELQEQGKSNSGDSSFLEKLNREAKNVVDEVNELLLTLDKVRTSSTISPGSSLSSLVSRRDLLDDYLSKGYRIEDKKRVKFSNAEVQIIADEKALLDQLIKERITSTREKLRLAEKSATQEKKIEEAKNKEIVDSYKRTLSEISLLDVEAKKVLLVAQKTGSSDRTDYASNEIHSRMEELLSEKKSIEEKGLKEVSKLRSEFDRDNNIRELEEFRKKEEIKRTEAKKEYKRISSEIIAIQKNIELSRENRLKYGSEYEDNGAEDRMINRLKALNERKLQLERSFNNSLAGIKHYYDIKNEESELKNAEKLAKKKLEKKNKEEFDFLHSYEGATAFSKSASSINEEKEAVKLLAAARDNLSTSTEGYKEKVKELNDAINKHRVSIETKTKTQEQEKTLLPSVRSEYTRMLREIDSLSEAYKRLKETQRSTGDKSLDKQKDEILSRWKDVAKAKAELEKNSQGQLEETYRKYRAERAKEELNEFIKLEREKARVAKEEAKKRAESAREQEENYNNSYEGALSFSRMARTAKEEIDAIKHLKKARENLSATDKKYMSKLEQLNGAIRRHERRLDLMSEKSKKAAGSHRGLMDISGQLARRLALVFSVSQITGYINKLASVRGEFELQKKALQAIIKDKDETDKLWNKTVELAVKSPFRVKELVTYTKQLAAYRIESEKLYDVNKMLADVSAGLGVEMNRLILAYGQVKAANYLRGTELRQFSEAGVNILEELAKYFSEVEGRAIKVGDVFEMVSKRMVSFSDVEEVFKRITSEGGTFYNMQEIQSETLKGQISNLYDSIDIMLNKIGEDNEGSLKGVVKTTREMVENWREVAYVIKGVVPAFLALNVASHIYNKGIRTSGKSTLWFSKTLTGMNSVWLGEAVAMDKATGSAYGWNRVQRIMIRTTAKVQAAMMGLWGAFKSFAPILIISGIAEVLRRYTEEERKLDELKSSVRKVVNEDISNLEKEKDGYIDLVNRLKSTNKGTLERKNIIGRLNSEYGEYLNFVVRENTEVSRLADAYDDVVKKMQNKAALDSLQKSYSVIEENYRNELQGAKDEFYKMFKDGTVKSTKSDKKFDFILPTKKEIDDIYILLQNKIRELKADELDSVREQQDLLQSIIKGYYGEDYYLGVNYDDIKLLDILLDKKRQEEEIQKEINALYEETLPSREANIALEKLQSKYIQKRKEIEKDESKTVFEKNKLLSNLSDMEKMDIIDIKVKFNIITKENGEAQKKAIKEWEEETTKSINEAVRNIKGFGEEDLSRVLISKDDQTNQSIQEYIKKIKGGWEKQNEIIREQIGLKSQGLSADEESLKNAIKLERLYRNVADLLGIEIGYRVPINKSVVDKINAAVSEKFRISELDALSSQDQLLSENNKTLSEHIKQLEMLKSSRLQGQEGLDDEIKKEQEYVNVLTKKGQMLGSYNQKLIEQGTIESINSKLSEEYQIKDEDRFKSQKDLLSEAKSDMDDAIARQDMLNHARAKGTEISDEEIRLIEEEVKFTTLKWKLLGGNDDEKEKKKRKAREILEERLRVIKELHEAYKDLNQTLSENESKEGALSKYGDAFRAAYLGTSLKLDDFYTSEQGMKEFYTKLIKYAKDAKDKIRVELAKGEIILEEKVKFKTESDEKLNKSVEDLFGNYEVSLDLESLNVPRDMAERLFGLKATNLEELRESVESMRDKFIGEKQEKQYEEFIHRISELEKKAQEERLKKYVHYLTKAKSERIRIKLDEIRQLEEIDKTFENKEDRELARTGVRKEISKLEDEADWKEFKESEMYSYMFEDLENVGTRTVKKLRKQLEDLKDSLTDLPLEQYKEIIQAIEKAENIEIDRTPFKAMRSARRDIRGVGLSRRELEENFSDSEDKIREYEKEIYYLDLIVEWREKGKKISVEDIQAASAYVDLENTSISAIKDRRKALEGNVESQKKISKETKDGLDNYENLKKATDAARDRISAYGEAVKKALTSVDSLLESFGLAEDSSARLWVNGAIQIANMIVQVMLLQVAFVAMGVAANSALGIIGWVAMALEGVAMIFSSIFGASDKKKQKQIQAEIKLVEELERQYEKLKEAIDAAYAVDTLRESTEMALKNIDERIASDQRQIAIENDRKENKRDYNHIAELQHEIEDLKEEKEKIIKESVEQLGGTYDFRQAAGEFLDAWLDAFQETGDGLDGLEDHFKEFMLNVVKQKAIMEGLGKILEPVFSKINKSLEDDFSISDAEYNQINALWDAQKKNADEFLKMFFERFPELVNSSKDSLTGLQKGIQGITEDTAEVLAAYLNSVRYFVADTNSKFTSYIEQFLSDDGSNPMASQLKIIARNTDSINRLLESVVIPSHPRGGSGIKVFID